MLGCSQGHLQSAHQEHATNHDPNVKIQTQPLHAETAFSIDWKVFLPKLSKKRPKNKNENSFGRTIYFNKALGKTLATAQRTLVPENTCLEGICFTANTQSHPEDCKRIKTVNSNQFYTANML